MEITSVSEKREKELESFHGATNTTRETPRRVLRIHLDLKLAHIDKSLIVYKVFYFLFHASLGSVFPFLPSYFKQIGFSSGQRAALFCVRPFIQLVLSPLFGFLGDQFVSKKMIVQFSTFAWLIITISMAFIEPTNQLCQLVSHNRTVATVVNSTHLKTGFFRRSINSFNIQGEPSLENHYLKTKTKFVEDDHTPEYGSTSGFKGDETSAGSTSMPVSTRHPIPSFQTTVKPPVIELNYTAKNILRDDISQLHDIFLSALTLLAIAEFLAVPAFLLIDASLLCKQVEENQMYYGQQRAFGSAGYIALFVTVSLLLNKSLKSLCGEMYADFVICFCFFCVCTILTMIAGSKFDFSYRRPSSNKIERLTSILYNRHYGTFFLAAGLMGLAHTVICQAFNWLLWEKKLGLSLVGVINFIELLGEPVGFLISGPVLRRIGVINTIFGLLIGLALNLMCCSFISNPWYVVPFGFVEEVMYGLSWVTCVTYMARVAPVDCHGTVQGILRAVFHGLGTACGAIIGGGLLTLIGHAAALRAWAVVSVLILLAFTCGLRELNSKESNYYSLLMTICSETKDTTQAGPRFGSRGDFIKPNSRNGDGSGKNTPAVEMENITDELNADSGSGYKNVIDSEDNSDYDTDENRFNFFRGL